jgi:hypothetical protein
MGYHEGRENGIIMIFITCNFFFIPIFEFIMEASRFQFSGIGCVSYGKYVPMFRKNPLTLFSG